MNRLKPLEKKFKAGFFRFWQPLLKRGRDDFKPLEGHEMNSVLFLRPEKIGDMAISFPVFDGLRRQYPHVRIGLLASPRNFDLIDGDPRFDRVFLYRKNVVKDRTTVAAIRREGYDAVIDMISGDSVTTLFLSQLCAPGKPRLGLQKDRFGPYYDFNYVDPEAGRQHIIDHTLKLLLGLGVDLDLVDRYAGPHLNRASTRKVEHFLADITDGAPGLKIGYNLSAGSPNRIWGADKSRDLVDRLSREGPESSIILITAPKDRQRAVELQRELNRRNVHPAPPNMRLSEVCALLSQLHVLISPDTSLVHIARSYRVPVVGLYNRYHKNLNLWRPYGQEVGLVISRHLDTIYDITVDEVMDAYRNTLNAYQLVAK
jgi:ADP-heptose:LPS heptosyltransferase